MRIEMGFSEQVNLSLRLLDASPTWHRVCELAEGLDEDLSRQVVLAAADTASEHDLTVRDALAVEAAVVGGCDRMVTESLPVGTVVRGVRIEDPAVGNNS